jgi:2'-5' RNA ligase
VRLFLAVDLPPTVCEHLVRVQDRFRELVHGRVGWTPPGQFHITVRFLGEQDDATRRKVEQELPNALQVPPLALHAVGAASLPERGPRRVLMVGYSSNSRYNHLWGRVEDACVAAGLERERRPPLFHSTLGRLRPPRRLDDRGWYQAFRDLFPGPPFVVDRVFLFESALRPKGAEHRKLGEFLVGVK